MPSATISPAVLERIELRRGRRHAHERIDVSRTALIVVDMQRAFVEPGRFTEVRSARDIIGNINRLASALRIAGGQVVFLQHTVDEDALESWSTYFGSLKPDVSEELARAFAPGSAGHALSDELDVRPQDLKVPKRRYSAFVPGSSELHAMLQTRGIDTLVITGTVTNVCCESTARDAMMMNYRIVFVGDANAAHTDHEHASSLDNVGLLFGDVRSTDDAIHLMQQGPK